VVEWWIERGAVTIGDWYDNSDNTSEPIRRVERFAVTILHPTTIIHPSIYGSTIGGSNYFFGTQMHEYSIKIATISTKNAECNQHRLSDFFASTSTG
jgi:hypothetical protein